MSNGAIADCVLCHPEEGTAHPGVLHLTDIGGIRPAHITMIERLASAGYTVLMPNLFYRTSRPPVLTRGLPPEAFMVRLKELAGPLTPEAIAQDSAIYLDVLSKQAPLAVVGHCYSGAVALRIAAAHPARIAAAASFHGGELYVAGSSTSPHLVLPQVAARLYFAHAVKDQWMPEAAIEKFNEALAAWGGRYESEVYEGAYHSWTAPDSPLHNPAQAARAFDKLKELLGAAFTG